MKNVLIYALVALFFVNIGFAESIPLSPKQTTVISIVKSIDADTHSFTIEKPGMLRFVSAIITLFRARHSAAITITTTPETKFIKKTSEGVTTGSFIDLAVDQKVQVKGLYIRGQVATATPKIQAVNVFILTPAHGRLHGPINPFRKECHTDAECAWCGPDCINKDLGRVCIQIAPPEGFVCKCINNECQRLRSGTIYTTTTTIYTTTTATIYTTTTATIYTTTTTTPTQNIIDDMTCEEACMAKGYKEGLCRNRKIFSRAVCKADEIPIGYTKDCITITGQRPLQRIDKTCCCLAG